MAGERGGDGGGGGWGDGVAVLVGFARALRESGVPAGTERVQAFLGAVDALGTGRREVYWAGRLTLCGSREDLAPYDRAFAAYFGDRAAPPTPPRPRTAPPPRVRGTAPAAEAPGDDGHRTGPAAPAAARAGSAEVLRHRDVARLSTAERAELHRLRTAFALRGEYRRTARRRPSRRGAVDPRRTVRELLRGGGEATVLRRRAPVHKPRRVVLLLDVSGSMSPYADALLRFAHAARHGRAGRAGRAAPATEVFTLGTRLTRVTRQLSHRDPDAALAAVGAAVPDWSGGTRLGETLRAFLDRWGRRGPARGAVVVVLSDGWERGDVTLLGAQARRLHRLAYRVVWANPRKARPGYAPLAGGMAAVLPHVDAFVAGHSLAALERLAAVVRGAAGA
ncbi:VWA domain-containing protein [Streptomyces sp. WMMC500]|uniref:vWA domain-containing protein n=1 Tax=Streptomyces sp. WMMC500 TaxID=3015154 RepID=UPI00248CE1C4|nr:VWA domain-containing protein [Streptomyces sp. WMMC500]WBB61452.1 VWA domain-containing protein [Streptomyces sp. WMMC500]